MSSEASLAMTVVRSGEESVSGASVEWYSMTEEPIDYEVGWGAARIQSNITSAKLDELRQSYNIPHYVKLLVPDAHERACFPRPNCVAFSEHLLKAGVRLPLHPFFRAMLRTFMLSPTQILPNGWSQVVGTYFLWKEVSLGEDIPLHVFESLFHARVVGKDDSKGWYYITPWGSHAPFVVGLPSSIKGWKESWFWVTGRWQMVEGDAVPAVTVPTQYYEACECLKFLQFHYFRSDADSCSCIADCSTRYELSEAEWAIIEDIYQRSPRLRSFSHLIERSKYFIDFSLMAPKGKRRFHL